MSNSAAATDAPLLGEPLPVELMNTIWADRAGVHDSLRDRTSAASWLDSVAPRADFTLAQDVPTLEQLNRLVALRDALRRLAAEATGDPRARAVELRRSDAVAAVNAAAAATPSWPQLQWDGDQPSSSIQVAGSGVDAAISAIAAESISLFVDARLQACLAPGCVLYFVKNHPRREWCSAACGNRARVARHYRRRRQP